LGRVTCPFTVTLVANPFSVVPFAKGVMPYGPLVDDRFCDAIATSALRAKPAVIF
jgi:hypothetical protein